MCCVGCFSHPGMACLCGLRCHPPRVPKLQWTDRPTASLALRHTLSLVGSSFSGVFVSGAGMPEFSSMSVFAKATWWFRLLFHDVVVLRQFDARAQQRVYHHNRRFECQIETPHQRTLRGAREAPVAAGAAASTPRRQSRPSTNMTTQTIFRAKHRGVSTKMPTTDMVAPTASLPNSPPAPAGPTVVTSEEVGGRRDQASGQPWAVQMRIEKLAGTKKETAICLRAVTLDNQHMKIALLVRGCSGTLEDLLNTLVTTRHVLQAGSRCQVNQRDEKTELSTPEFCTRKISRGQSPSGRFWQLCQWHVPQ